MRRVVLSLIVGLALLVLPAVAQESNLTQEQTTTATGVPVQEERTSPDIGTTAPGGGLTLSGTVVSWNDEQLVVKTTTGIEHIQLLPATRRPATFQEGQAVTVDYTRSSVNGVMIADEVRLGALGLTTTAAPESALEQKIEEGIDELGDTADEIGAELSEIDEELAGEADVDATSTTLPATGSKAPLAALLGLLALGAAAIVRRL